ncbi:MAG: hypothetical protein AABX75_01835, partial [Nanoarchaeota archaeon]
VGKIRGKKKWFTVLAPEIFKSKELVDITAYEPKEIVGRPVDVTLSQLTDRPKDQQKKLTLKITDTKGEKAITEPWKFYFVESFIQRAGRRYKEKLYIVPTVSSKDSKKLKIKLFIMATNKLHHSVRADLIVALEKKLREFVSELNAFEMFLPENIDKLSDELREATKKIFPADKIFVWKITV